MKDDERLKSLEIKKFHGFNEPLDKRLLNRVSKKTNSIIIGPMPRLNGDIRASMTECVASFFEASQKLKNVDISEYYDSN